MEITYYYPMPSVDILSKRKNARFGFLSDLTSVPLQILSFSKAPTCCRLQPSERHQQPRDYYHPVPACARPHLAHSDAFFLGVGMQHQGIISIMQTSGFAGKEPRVLSVQLFNIMDVLDSRNWEAKDATRLGDSVTAD